MNICKLCEQPFEPVNKYKIQKYCLSCVHAFWESYNPKPLPPKKCSICGKDFMPKMRTQIYCSSCKSKGARNRKSKERKEYLKRYQQKPEYKEYLRQRRKSPEFIEKKREYAKKYRQNHKDKTQAQTHKYRAKKKNVERTLTDELYLKTLLHFHNSCAYCKRNSTLEKDHFIPLSKNGGYTPRNIVPACKSCNSSKCDREPRQWLIEKFPDGERIYQEIVSYLLNQPAF